MESSGDHHVDGNLATFRLLYTMVQLIGLALVVMMGTWVFVFLGGLSWSSTPSIQFNWHPLLMTIGMIFLYGNSILVYRGFRYVRKRNLKLVHASLFGTIFLLVVIAGWAVFDSHNLHNPPLANLYSLHSWVGLLAITLFMLQWLGGFFSFLFPLISMPMREKIMPYHVFFGISGYVLAIAAAIMGLAEKAQYKLGPDLQNLPSEAVLINFMGLLFILFGGIVIHLATNKHYRRIPLPEDVILLTGHDESQSLLDDSRSYDDSDG